MEWSLPLWERGLKFTYVRHTGEWEKVAPLVGAWIEITMIDGEKVAWWSLPLWERGLKFLPGFSSLRNIGRSPCGSVD